MIVEFIGSSGAGKTTLARMLQRRGGMTRPVMLAADMVMDRPGRRWIHNPKMMNLIADVTALPSFLRASDHDREFVRFAFNRLRRHAPSRFSKFNYMREVVRNVGMYELARGVAEEATILTDEGTVLTAYHLFVYSEAPFNQTDLERFARLVPQPDRVVYVKAPHHVLVDRAMRRPDRRRELATGDRTEVEHWIARAQEVFEGLVVAEPIRDRLLIVDNADSSPDSQEAATARIAAFINEQPPADHAAKPSASPDMSRT